MKEDSPKAGALLDIHTLKSIGDIEPVDRPAEMNRLAKLIEEELKDPSIPRALVKSLLVRALIARQFY